MPKSAEVSVPERGKFAGRRTRGRKPRFGRAWGKKLFVTSGKQDGDVRLIKIDTERTKAASECSGCA